MQACPHVSAIAVGRGGAIATLLIRLTPPVETADSRARRSGEIVIRFCSLDIAKVCVTVEKSHAFIAPARSVHGAHSEVEEESRYAGISIPPPCFRRAARAWKRRQCISGRPAE